MDKAKRDTFAWVDWIIAEREKRDWSQADLARRTGLTRTSISLYEKRKRPNPDMGSLTRISEVFGFPADHLPRLAGLLPSVPDADEQIEQIAHEAESLNPQDKEEVIAFIRMKQNLRKKNG